MRQANLEQHIKTNYDYLVNTALRLTRDIDRAREAVQGAIVECIQDCEDFDEDGPATVKTWLTTAVRFNAIDLFRRAVTRNRTISTLDAIFVADDAEHDHVADLAQPEQPSVLGREDRELATVDLRRDVQRALMTLPEVQRRVVSGLALEERTILQVAEELRVGRGVVYRLWLRAAQSLRRNLRAYQPGVSLGHRSQFEGHVACAIYEQRGSEFRFMSGPYDSYQQAQDDMRVLDKAYTHWDGKLHWPSRNFQIRKCPLQVPVNAGKNNS